MKSIGSSVKFLLNLSRAQSSLVKRFDAGMGNGIGFNEFLILFYLSQAPEQKMRRIDLAEKVGLTASGVTRLLLPMEKIGLVTGGSVEEDARVRSVILSKGGKQKLSDALKRFEFLADNVCSGIKTQEIKDFSDLLIAVGGKILMS